MKKLYFPLLVGLALVIIIESVFIVDIIKTKEKVIQLPLVSPVIKRILPETKEGILEIVLEKNQKVSVGKNLKAQLLFNSPNEPVAGVDATLTFDPEVISVTEISGNQKVFEQIIINKQQQKNGRIKLTAYSPTGTLLGKQTLASITVLLLKNQPATLGIEFLGPDVVTDSNLVSQTTQKDILGKVQSLKLSFQ